MNHETLKPETLKHETLKHETLLFRNIECCVEHGMVGNTDVYQHAAINVVRKVQAVVAKSDQPVLALRHGCDAAFGINVRIHRGIKISRQLVITGERVGIVLDPDLRVWDRLSVMRSFDAYFSG